jgi:signal transduction histidine kinase
MACVILPLAIVGLWTTRLAARSARTLLANQLETTLGQSAADVDRRWSTTRSDLLLLSENEPVRQMLVRDSAGPTPAFVARAWDHLNDFNRVVIRDRRGAPRVTLQSSPVAPGDRATTPAADLRGIAVTLPIVDLVEGDTIGSVDAVVRAANLVPEIAARPARDAPVTAVATMAGTIIAPQSVDDRLFRDETVEWSGQHWITLRRRLPDLNVELLEAGAIDPYVQPFQQSARSVTILLALVAAAVILAITIVTRRMTREVERQMAQREALAAVGEFASEMAHEVRNPLSAIRLDLQRLAEVAGDPDDVRRITSRAERQIGRIDRAVTGALRVARGGSIQRRRVDLHNVLHAAGRAAQPEFTHRGARLVIQADAAAKLDGDAAALEQLFVNLLINAAQALSVDGSATVTVRHAGADVEVTVADTGSGMTQRDIEQTRQPFRSSKRDGTGLGLKIARRIVAAHNGALDIDSVPGRGTTVRVTLPARG